MEPMYRHGMGDYQVSPKLMDCKMVHSEVNLNRAASQLQLSTSRIVVLQAATFNKRTDLAATYAQSCQDYGGDKIELETQT